MMRVLVEYLLGLFPAEFRQGYGDDMLATFDDRWAERAGIRTAVRTVIDLARSA